ncbi:MAG: hypothetical protein ACR2GW_15050 [Pyrinomonadaceae bacterium]
MHDNFLRHTSLIRWTALLGLRFVQPPVATSLDFEFDSQEERL